MKIKIIAIACGVVTIFSNCGQKKEGLHNVLTSGCYWDILDKGSEHPINSCYKFNESGDCNFFYYFYFNKIKTDSVYLFDDDDVVISNRWEVVKDSIKIRSNKYHVITFNSDSIILTATNKDTMVLIKNCKTVRSNR